MLNSALSPNDQTLNQRQKFTLSLPSAVLVSQCLILTILVLFPLMMLFFKALFDRNDHYVGLNNFTLYFSNPALTSSIAHSLVIASTATMITLIIATIYAYAITSSRIPFKGFFRLIALLPILAPSLLPAIALVYLFGHQGMLKFWLGTAEIYGPIGILMGYCFWLFPSVLMIMVPAFRGLDARLFEASRSLGAGAIRTHIKVMFPAIRYGLLSATMVAFTYVLTDFGIPKVIGGSYNMMALDVYKQIIGQQNFSMGAVVSLMLLIPALLAFVIDRVQKQSQERLQQQEARPYQAKKDPWKTAVLLVFCSGVALCLLAVVGTAVFASFAKYWPYDLSMGLMHYHFEFVDGGGWKSYFNSLKLACLVTIIGTVFVFIAAFSSQRLKDLVLLKNLLQGLALLPMAIPGLVLGIAYIFFFNHPNNPLNFLYGTLAILVLSTVVHYYTVPHLTALTALKQLPTQLDSAAMSLGVSVPTTFWRVYLPVCLPAVLDISVYFFVNAMTTVSAAIFLYSPDTTLASVAILNMDDAGDTAPAAAMGVLILATSLGVKVLHWLITSQLLKRTQRWRQEDG
ncbi:putative 2-aminoethylphosphonate ABC transporter permease subunit [Aquirhabdus sp.]|uniref:putative 2-aminoethylphosphonate ABC transporter permease subunit n=1 Tax=Aquirhabdus sp. TaxID=2824160 RepID=UPI00396C41B9